MPSVHVKCRKKSPGETVPAHHRENLGGQPGSSLDKSQKKEFIRRNS